MGHGGGETGQGQGPRAGCGEARWWEEAGESGGKGKRQVVQKEGGLTVSRAADRSSARDSEPTMAFSSREAASHPAKGQLPRQGRDTCLKEVSSREEGRRGTGVGVQGAQSKGAGRGGVGRGELPGRLGPGHCVETPARRTLLPPVSGGTSRNAVPEAGWATQPPQEPYTTPQPLGAQSI